MPARPPRSVAASFAALLLVPFSWVSAVPRAAAVGSAPEPAYGMYAWPLRGQVMRPFEAPSTRYGPGHRGIDIAAPLGSPVAAANAGRVAFAGWVAGSLYVSVDHPDGIRTTYSWLSSLSVSLGEEVRRGQRIGTSGPGHPGIQPPHLHLGARIGSVYIDPMLLLEQGSVVGLIHLAPLDAAASLVPSPAPPTAARGPPGPVERGEARSREPDRAP